MRNSIKTFGLALMAACSLMALFAVAAQAEDLTDGGKAGNFLVLGLTTLVAGAELTGTALHGILLILSKNAYILCPEGDIKGKGLSATEVLIEVTYLKCHAFNHKTNAELTACPILGEPSAETIRAHGIATAKLHGEELFVLLTPAAGSFFAEVKFGEFCGIGVKVKIGGSVVGLVDNGNATTDHLITFSEAIQKLLGDKLLYGSAESFINGVAHVELTGTHKGCTWAVD